MRVRTHVTPQHERRSVEASAVRRDRQVDPRPRLSIEDIRKISRAVRPDDWNRVSSRFAWFSIALEACGVAAIILWLVLS